MLSPPRLLHLETTALISKFNAKVMEKEGGPGFFGNRCDNNWIRFFDEQTPNRASSPDVSDSGPDVAPVTGSPLKLNYSAGIEIVLVRRAWDVAPRVNFTFPVEHTTMLWQETVNQLRSPLPVEPTSGPEGQAGSVS
jgi:hypothetical protein